MKEIKYLILLLCLSVTCKKNTPENPTPSVIGTWVWFKSTSGLLDTEHTPASTGRSWQLQFKADLSCLQSGDLFPAKGGAYTLTKESQSAGGEKWLNVTFTDTAWNNNYYIISANELTLNDRIEADGPSHYFMRK